MRSSRLSWETRCAVAVMRCSGRSMRPAEHPAQQHREPGHRDERDPVLRAQPRERILRDLALVRRFAAGFRPGDVVLNTFSYHLTPGGFIFDASARALGCAVIPAGPGNTEQQFELIEAYRPVGYSGTPDFLKILLDAAASAGRDVSSIKRALVSGAAFPNRCRMK